MRLTGASLSLELSLSRGGTGDEGGKADRNLLGHRRRLVDGGAQLVQAYTGFVYGGPAWPTQVNARIARRAEAAAR